MPGYRPLVSQDPREQELRERWHALKRAAAAPSATGDARLAFEIADADLSAYLWDRTRKDIDEDRRKHPKAKRNQSAPEGATPSGGRCLP